MASINPQPPPLDPKEEMFPINVRLLFKKKKLESLLEKGPSALVVLESEIVMTVSRMAKDIASAALTRLAAEIKPILEVPGGRKS